MRNRLTLQAMLEEILGSENVYFQPSTSAKMRYPAIVYHLSDIDNEHANDGVYASHKQWEIIVIDKDPDSPIYDRVNQIPSASFMRSYVADNLNHWVFTITY
jgi:hypothetical protein